MPRRVLEGTVVSDKQDKTVTVLVERRTMHPIYKKYLKKSKKFAVHDEANHFKSGDHISIIETRPLSKNKSWNVMIDGKEGMIGGSAPKETEKKLAKSPKKDVKEASSEKTEAKKAPAKKTTAKKAPAKKATAKEDTKETKK